MSQTTALHPSLHASAGLTLRDLVDTTPEAVTDSWCRQVADSLLRSVATQQAQGRPHRIIMPDTVVVHAGGAAELLSSLDDDEQFQPPVAVDLKAVAAVLHFAITGESPPGAALLPRGLPQFSDGLLGAIDDCLHGDRTRRPQSIDAMRMLLGLPVDATASAVPPVPAVQAVSPPVRGVPEAPLPVSAQESVADELEQAIAGLAAAVGMPVEHEEVSVPVTEPVSAAVSAPASAPGSAPNTSPPIPPASAVAARPAPARLSRPLLACLAIGILGAAGFFIYEKGRQAGAQAAASAAPAVTAVAAVPAAVPASPPVPVVEAPPQADNAAVDAPTATVSAAVPPKTAAAAAPASVTYKLVIKPWGDIYVDGVKRGASPPLKSLTLSGAHTVRIDNPDFPSKTIEVGPGSGNSTRIEHAFQ